MHLNIEKRLTTLVGDAGKRLHTGRSRNDQVATDIRLYLRDSIDDIQILLGQFQTALLDLAEREAATPMPGFTHLQVAQPITFGHHVLAWYEMTRRDAERFADGPETYQPPAARRRRAGRHDLPDRPRIRRRRTRFRGRLRKLARRRLRPGFRHRILRGQRPVDDARLAHIRRTGAVDEPALRLREDCRPFLHRQFDHAAEEESGRPRTGARQDPAASTAT